MKRQELGVAVAALRMQRLNLKRRMQKNTRDRIRTEHLKPTPPPPKNPLTISKILDPIFMDLNYGEEEEMIAFDDLPLEERNRLNSVNPPTPPPTPTAKPTPTPPTMKDRQISIVRKWLRKN